MVNIPKTKTLALIIASLSILAAPGSGNAAAPQSCSGARDLCWAKCSQSGAIKEQMQCSRGCGDEERRCIESRNRRLEASRQGSVLRPASKPSSSTAVLQGAGGKANPGGAANTVIAPPGDYRACLYARPGNHNGNETNCFDYVRCAKLDPHGDPAPRCRPDGGWAH